MALRLVDMFKGQIGAESLGIHPEVFISIMLIK